MSADKPSADRFVIRPLQAGKASALPEQAGPFRQLDPLSGARGGWEVALAEPAASARAAWRVLQDKVGGEFQVLPVLDDGDGDARYPTGEVMVRFRATATDEQLQALEKSLGLELVGRSRFIGNQARFRLRDPAGVYAPELVGKLAARDDIDAAWLDAESRYKRAV